MLKNDTLKNGTSRIGLYESAPLHGVIRKLAVHKRTLEVHNVNFVRYIIYIMPLTEYSEVHRNLLNMQNYNLQERNIIMQYYFDSENEVPVESSKHGNAKSTIARDFRPTAHSVKQKIKETVQAEKNAAPQILSEQVKESDAPEMSQLLILCETRNKLAITSKHTPRVPVKIRTISLTS